jgi:hypothetical protein
MYLRRIFSCNSLCALLFYVSAWKRLLTRDTLKVDLNLAKSTHLSMIAHVS